MLCIQETGFCTSSFYWLYQLSWFLESEAVKSCVYNEIPRLSDEKLTAGNFPTKFVFRGEQECQKFNKLLCGSINAKTCKQIGIQSTRGRVKREEKFLSISLRFRLEIFLHSNSWEMECMLKWNFSPVVLVFHTRLFISFSMFQRESRTSVYHLHVTKMKTKNDEAIDLMSLLRQWIEVKA